MTPHRLCRPQGRQAQASTGKGCYLDSALEQRGTMDVQTALMNLKMVVAGWVDARFRRLAGVIQSSRSVGLGECVLSNAIAIF